MAIANCGQSNISDHETQVSVKQRAMLFSWTRPRSYWDVVGKHLPIALITGIPLFLSFLVPLSHVPLRACSFLHITGHPCPFCGFTRSFWAFSNAEWSFAFYNYPLALLVYVAVVLVFLWNTIGLLFGMRIERGRFLRLDFCHTNRFIVLVITLLVFNWVYRLNLGLC